jgi:RNA 3'-terminal phosphate cyclase (ATP)
MIEIDGSFGEGGGQILRTALSLSCLFNKPFRIFNIRKSRKKPGLMPQHLTCVKAAQLLSNAEISGDSLGSTELLFKPMAIKGGEFFFDIGTAGSTSLLAQTLIPSLIFLKEKTSLTLKGGTHVPFSPSYNYISEVFAPILRIMGIKISLSIEAYGFYPKGGGKIKVDIFPTEEINPIRIKERGEISYLIGSSGVGNLPLKIAERQKNATIKRIIESGINIPIKIDLLNCTTPGQGTFLFLRPVTELSMQQGKEISLSGFGALGHRGKRAEEVGEEAAREFIDYYFSGAAFDKHLADQIVLYLSLCKEKSYFTTHSITNHLITNLYIIKLFTDCKYIVKGQIGEKGEVIINVS